MGTEWTRSLRDDSGALAMILTDVTRAQERRSLLVQGPGSLLFVSERMVAELHAALGVWLAAGAPPQAMSPQAQRELEQAERAVSVLLPCACGLMHKAGHVCRAAARLEAP